MEESTTGKPVINKAKGFGVFATSFAIATALALPGWPQGMETDHSPALLFDYPVEPTPDDEPTDPAATATEPGDESALPDDVTAPPAPTESPLPEGTEIPEYGEGTVKEKWHRFTDAVRGLATWNLFNDRVTVRAYARVQVDGTVANGDDELVGDVGELANSVKLRRMILLADGTIDHHLHYVFGYDFGADLGVWNAYIEGIDSGLDVFGYHIGQFMVGSFQEPFGLERSTSGFFSGFLERSLPTQTFTPGNNLGYMVHGNPAKKRMSLAVGFFSFGQSNDENASNSTLSVTARVTGLPVWHENGRKLFHLGLGVSARSPQGNSTQYRSRPEARFVDYFADTGDIDSSTIDLLGVEAAMVSGPLWLQSEIIYSKVVSVDYGNLGFWGSYLQAGYFLTGEVRPYNRGDGTFGRVIPGQKYSGGMPLKKSNGGAIEVVGRISNIDLDDKGIDGGKMSDLSFGFNWYMNATSKVMLNYIRSNFKDTGIANIVLLRYQYRPMTR